MKKLYLIVLSASIIVFATSSVTIKRHSSSQNGIVGYTGAPGSFGTCASCHGGGTASGITITAVPDFTNNMYAPDSLYQFTVSGSAAGFSHFGFACEILNAGNTNAGSLSPNISGGVKIGQFNSQRHQAIHTTPKTASIASFTFPWKAPAAGNATVYAIVNAVNGNNNSNGDMALAPVKMTLEPLPAPVDTTDLDTTSMSELQNLAQNLKVYPNPATVFAQMDFSLNKSSSVVTIITDLKGREIRRSALINAGVGQNSVNINVRDLETGIYFVSLHNEAGKLGQKMLIVQ